MNLKKIAIVLALVLATSGCGGSKGLNSDSSNAIAKSSSDQEFVFMSDFRNMLTEHGIDCTNYKQNEGVLAVKEEGSCSFNGSNLTLDLYGDEKTARAIIDALKGLGGYTIAAKNWSITVLDEKNAKEISSKLGLKVE